MGIQCSLWARAEDVRTAFWRDAQFCFLKTFAIFLKRPLGEKEKVSECASPPGSITPCRKPSNLLSLTFPTSTDRDSQMAFSENVQGILSALRKFSIKAHCPCRCPTMAQGVGGPLRGRARIQAHASGSACHSLSVTWFCLRAPSSPRSHRNPGLAPDSKYVFSFKNGI